MRALCAALLLLMLAACASSPAPVRTPAPPVSGPAPVTMERPAVPPAAGASSSAAATPTTPGKGGYYLDDGPGDKPPADMASIPDAQPRKEALHPRANRPYVALGQSFTPLLDASDYKARGVASWYGRRFHGKPTSSGEPYDMYAMTAAHPTLPIPSYVRVTNVQNGKSVVVRVNDRGPFKKDRLIDLSYTAAWKLGYTARGSTEVEVEVISTDESAPVGSAPAGATPVAVADVRVTEASPATPQAGPVPGPAAAFYLQLGAFGSLGNAEGFRDYAQQELKAPRDTLHIVPDGSRYRLQLGPYADAARARAIIDSVTRALKLTPFVVQR